VVVQIIFSYCVCSDGILTDLCNRNSIAPSSRQLAAEKQRSFRAREDDRAFQKPCEQGGCELTAVAPESSGINRRNPAPVKRRSKQ
jgi:hypothetical protein